ncbi:cell division protein FtsL [Anaerosphaera aminiphila DSM 21120]|uniref:Cell division protein FtsL n=1 Tax=Anaerosphaera aminiphila DSM 21120 TaxID=1120995 RepID=A0A1M5R0M5_9FIRM|nr:septum formation initiator family protein [Anaerosphaera aminiphila]SHH19997.1 cell division protein FtsL [Anaerosphaera aminiphila DSM 21120]
MKRKRTFPILFSIIIFAAMIYGAVVISRSISLRSQKVSEISENTREIETLKKDIEELQGEIDNSETPEFIEEVARKEFGMVKPREVIYVDKDKSSEKDNLLESN